MPGTVLHTPFIPFLDSNSEKHVVGYEENKKNIEGTTKK
jgi:hypothetical protein